MDTFERGGNSFHAGCHTTREDVRNSSANTPDHGTQPDVSRCIILCPEFFRPDFGSRYAATRSQSKRKFGQCAASICAGERCSSAIAV